MLQSIVIRLDLVSWVTSHEDQANTNQPLEIAFEGHRTRPDGSDFKSKQIGVNEATNSRELPYFIQRLTTDHPLQDGKAAEAIKKITIADTGHLSDSWFWTEILGSSNAADVEFVDPSANDGEYGIVAVQLATPTGSVVLD